MVSFPLLKLLHALGRVLGGSEGLALARVWGGLREVWLSKRERALA